MEGMNDPHTVYMLLIIHLPGTYVSYFHLSSVGGICLQ